LVYRRELKVIRKIKNANEEFPGKKLKTQKRGVEGKKTTKKDKGHKNKKKCVDMEKGEGSPCKRQEWGKLGREKKYLPAKAKFSRKGLED